MFDHTYRPPKPIWASNSHLHLPALWLLMSILAKAVANRSPWTHWLYCKIHRLPHFSNSLTPTVFFLCVKAECQTPHHLACRNSFFSFKLINTGPSIYFWSCTFFMHPSLNLPIFILVFNFTLNNNESYAFVLKAPTIFLFNVHAKAFHHQLPVLHFQLI